MSKIELKDIDKFYGNNHVLKHLNLTIDEGEFMTLLGPSGCGKTTTLRIISGLEKPQNGTIKMNDKIIVNSEEKYYEKPGNRGLNLVFQSYALWPHMTVFENVAFGLSVIKTPKEKIQKKVMNSLERMHIKDFYKRYPAELSGGQQQRVAIARAIVSEPKVLLLDEPLSNLDAKLRIEMRSELKRLHRDLGTTIIYVTHDQVGALTMSTKIAIFFEGVLEQVATPMEIYENPASVRVAKFIANPKANLINAVAYLRNNKVIVNSNLGEMVFEKDDFSVDIDDKEQFECVIGVRPEKISISKDKKENAVEVPVYAVQTSGSDTTVQIKLEDLNLFVKEIGIKYYDVDDKIYITTDLQKVNIYSKKDGKLIKKAKPD